MISLCSNNIKESLFLKHRLVSRTYSKKRTIDQSAGGKLRDKNAEESWALLEDLALYDNESRNDPRDFAKPVKAISLPQDVLSTFDRRLIGLENQVQRLMEAHLAPKQPVQVNKISSSCEIYSGPHDTQCCMENPEQAFVEYASLRIDEAGGLVSNFMASQDARLSKFEANFKQQQSEITNKIDTVLKAITDRIMGALPSDTVKNLKLNVNSATSVLSACSYPIEDPQCSSQIHNSINAIKMCLIFPSFLRYSPCQRIKLASLGFEYNFLNLGMMGRYHNNLAGGHSLSHRYLVPLNSFAYTSIHYI
ncbi:hypothetical protein Tco_1473855 [Tanacetum coccineum]